MNYSLNNNNNNSYVNQDENNNNNSYVNQDENKLNNQTQKEEQEYQNDCFEEYPTNNDEEKSTYEHTQYKLSLCRLFSNKLKIKTNDNLINSNKDFSKLKIVNQKDSNTSNHNIKKYNNNNNLNNLTKNSLNIHST